MTNNSHKCDSYPTCCIRQKRTNFCATIDDWFLPDWLHTTKSVALAANHSSYKLTPMVRPWGLSRLPTRGALICFGVAQETGGCHQHWCVTSIQFVCLALRVFSGLAKPRIRHVNNVIESIVLCLLNSCMLKRC